MGQESEQNKRVEDFKNYQINEHIIEKNNAIFMHDLPAHHGEEISEKLYNAVAVALAYVYKLDNGEDIDAPDIYVPEDVRFNENGKILKLAWPEMVSLVGL